MNATRPAAAGRLRVLLGWLQRAQWRAQAGRTVACIAAVAIGVALALAIHLVNATALSSFQQAIDAINGQADLRITASSGLLDEALLERVATLDGVETASPVLDQTLQVRGTQGGTAQSLRFVATEPLTALGITPALVPPGPPSQQADRLWLSAAAWRMLDLPEPASIDPEAAPRLQVLTGAGLRSLAVAGIAEAVEGEALALMDLGSAQWAFGQSGQLSRIDLRLATGQPLAARRAAIAAALGKAVQVTAPAEDGQRMSNISRAYRVNLDMLALVALLTGTFIVFAALSLAALRQQPVFALFTILGAGPGFAARALLGQASAIGLAGAVVGTGAGIALAQLLISVVGGDLGGGYFRGSRPQLSINWSSALGFGLLGWLTAIVGGLAPALSTRHWPAMSILRHGALQAIESDRAARLRLLVAIGVALAGTALAFAPPIANLPLPAYAAIALLLVAGILATPTIISLTTGLLETLAERRLWRHPPAWLALAYQRRASAAIAIALAGVVASFALAVAMIVMVSSFRASVDNWLDTVLPADWYVRLSNSTMAVDENLQQAVRQAAGESRVEFLRARQISLDPLAPPVSLLARDASDADALATRLPLTGELLPASKRPTSTSSAVPLLDAFVSEPMISRHGYQLGQLQTVELDGRPVRLWIRGIWRDYARQGGAIAVVRDDYRRLSGDAGITDLALWPAPDVDGTALVQRLRDVDPLLAAGDWHSAAELRRISLAIFDRSFAITHVLEAVAVLVGLFGVATTYASQALTRSREFGMLRHLGVERGAVVAQLAIEAIVGTTVAVIWGAVIGFAIARVLIDRVNPQSFHWTMDYLVPWPLLAGVGLALIVTAVLTAMLATRSASSGEPAAALRRDA